MNYYEFASNEIRFYRPDKLPVVSKEKKDELIRQQPQFSYSVVGSRVASSGDLGYVYGTVSPAPDGKISYYLRIWKKENGEWKIVLDLLTHQ